MVPGGVEVTGTTAMFSDIADLLSGRLWLVIGFVVGTSILLLAMVFPSIVVPLKAAAMNLLASRRRTASSRPSSSGDGASSCSGSITPCLCRAGCRS